MKRILIIDDDVEMCGLLTKFLARENFQADAAHDGAGGLAKSAAENYCFIILDVMLPDFSGFDVLRRIRAVSSVPVLMLTAKGDEIDRIIGLEIGADDYLPKPFNPRELVARLQAVLRRAEISAQNNNAAAEKIIVGDLVLELEARTVSVGEKNVELTTTEFDVLRVLAASAGKIVSREKLAADGMDKKLALFDRSVDMIISKLRQKLGNHAGNLERIRAVRNAGYIYARSSD